MPLYLGVKCAQCSTFQVQQETKARKWACRLCGLKQSLRQVYCSGQPKDCRPIVQQLNLARGAVEASEPYEYDFDRGQGDDTREEEEEEEEESGASRRGVNGGDGKNKWADFVDDSEEAALRAAEEEDRNAVSFDLKGASA
jgi:hypothetical protein